MCWGLWAFLPRPRPPSFASLTHLYSGGAAPRTPLVARAKLDAGAGEEGREGRFSLCLFEGAGKDRGRGGKGERCCRDGMGGEWLVLEVLFR